MAAGAQRPGARGGVDEGQVLALIGSWGVGPAEGRNIRALSQRIVERHGGRVPEDFAALEALPGGGHKTASVVMSHAFGHPAFPVDTHIHRLAQRWGLTDGKSVLQTERDLKHLFPEDAWNKLHLQIIFYGREFCTARGCDGTVCEICRTCFAKRRKPVSTKKA